MEECPEGDNLCCGYSGQGSTQFGDHDGMARWTLLLQEFEFYIYHRPGVQHAVADYFSQLESDEAGDGVRDKLPDAELFMITTEPATY